ncbi:cytochrome c biogenesis CcdA family protein [Salinibaculum rarum]|uniref:cytochrome c biogenesis CcdA family protein n=1 Tax=Salinibaculum rarum TaxID=3058903 RepID=UPI00265FB4D1|nr:cytochrome c biogenesis protein CcdA [Salinibaculum sp. KK48]
MTGLPGYAAVFGAGILTILSPCCLPLLPAVVSSGAGHRYRPLALVLGSVLSFTALGVVVGGVATLSPRTFRLPAAVLLLAFGAVLVDDDLNALYERYASRVAGRADRLSGAVGGERSLFGGFVTGSLLGVIWLPCVGPILGGVLAVASTGGSLFTSTTLMLTYGLGFAVPLLATAYVGKDILRHVGVTATRQAARRLVGAVLLVTGVALLFDVDKLLIRLFVDL